MTPANCFHCRTELPPDALACPACASLIHADVLKQLAGDAAVATHAGELLAARDHWTAALLLLPIHSRQHAVITERVAELTGRIKGMTPDSEAVAPHRRPWWRRGAPALVAGGLLLLSKLKFLLLGLTKVSTVLSMFAFLGVYWSIYGWPLALGLVVSIYIHEMGHVAMLRNLGIQAGAPLFIPGMGAFVLLKQHIADPLVDAKIGLAGPVWGLGAAVAASAVYTATGGPIWLAIAQLTGYINLFNLIPVWQLDGSRGVHVLGHRERWVLVAAVALAFVLTGQRLVIIVGAVAVWRCFQRDAGPGDTRVLATFAALILALSWIARGVR